MVAKRSKIQNKFRPAYGFGKRKRSELPVLEEEPFFLMNISLTMKTSSNANVNLQAFTGIKMDINGLNYT